MRSNGSWATDNEVVATATLLQTPVYVYTSVTGVLRWLKHSPLFLIDNVFSCGECIYLINLHDHFQRVVNVAQQ